MKLLVHILLLLSCLLLKVTGVKAQSWTNGIKSDNPTFTEIQKAFYKHYREEKREEQRERKKTGIEESEADEEMEKFKRWEWYWQSRLLDDGRLAPASFAYDNWKAYLKTRPTAQLKTMAGNWAFKGPSTSIGGYRGIGRVNCMAFHPTDANTFWIGTPAGGIWKTTNGGTSWTTSSDNLPVLGVSDIAVHPTNGNILYIATGDGDASFTLKNGAGNTKSIGVLKSIDGGATWTQTGLNWSVTAQKLIRRLLINPVNPQILIATASDGIWLTTDGGTSWTNVQGGNFFIDAEFKPGDPSIVYASTYDRNGSAKIFRSANSGSTWTMVAALPANVMRINLAVTPKAPALVDALCANTQGGLAGLWYSNNSGATYTQYFNGTNTTNFLHNTYNASGTGGQGHYDLAYAINPANENDIWLGGINTWRTTDGGTNWTLNNFWHGHASINPNGAPVVHADKHFIAFHPLVPGTMFECNDGGLYKTTNSGATWTDLSNGLGISQMYRIGVAQTVLNDVICGLQDNGTKEFYNNAWHEHEGGDGMECLIDYTNGNVMYSSYVNGLFYKTTDGGANWNVILQNDGTGAHAQSEWVTPFIMHPTNRNTLLVGKAQVFQSTDGGANWTQLGSLPGVSGHLIAMAYAPSNPQVIYVASASQVFKTADGGTTWSLVATSNNRITYIAVDPANAQRVWITLSGYTANTKVFYSADGGASWNNFSGSLPNLPVNCIVYQKNSNDGLYIGTDAGVFYRNASMTDWITFNTGLPNVIVTELEISYNNNKLWAATFGRGLWNSDLFAGNGCTAPAAPTASSQSVCQNTGTVTLTATPPAGSVVDWYNALTGGTLLQSGSNTYVVNAAGTYYAESRDAATGCKSNNRTPVTVTFTTPPVVTINSSSPSICNGASSTLTASGATTYTWSPAAGLSSTTNATVTASPTVTTTYTVTGTTNGCSSTQTTTVTVNPSVVPAITISYSGCPSGTLVFTSNAANQGNGGNIQWFVNNVLSGTGAAFTLNNATNGAQVYARLTSDAICANPQSVNSAVTTINCTTTAVPNIDGLELFEIAPNPTTGLLIIKLKLNQARKVAFEIIDNTGRNVYDEEGVSITGSHTKRLDLTGKPQGIYYLKATIGNKTITEKIVVSR